MSVLRYLFVVRDNNDNVLLEGNIHDVHKLTGFAKNYIYSISRGDDVSKKYKITREYCTTTLNNSVRIYECTDTNTNQTVIGSVSQISEQLFYSKPYLYNIIKGVWNSKHLKFRLIEGV